MAAPRNTYVDPAAGVDFATGGLTVNDPYLTITFANLDIVASHAGPHADGEQVNLRSTVDDTPVATLITPGGPAVDAPYIIRGYNFVANDGGIGGIDGGAAGFSIMDQQAAGENYTHLIDVHLHNTGAAAAAVVLQNYSSAIRCEFDTTAGYALSIASWGLVADCYLHDSANHTLLMAAQSLAIGNYVESPSTAGQSTLFLNGDGATAIRNILVLDDLNSYGLRISAHRQRAIGNSILSTVANVLSGIWVDVNALQGIVILDQLIEGFSGVGGEGIDFGNLIRHVQMYANNSFYNNTLDENNRGDFNYEEDNDVPLAASPFMKEGAISHANRFDYFKPAIPVRGRAFPNGCRFDRGAVQVRLAVERTIPETTIVTIPERVVFDPLE